MLNNLIKNSNLAVKVKITAFIRLFCSRTSEYSCLYSEVGFTKLFASLVLLNLLYICI